MKTEIKPITPAEAGLSLIVTSGPRGSVREDWPCIEYTLQLMLNSRLVWSGEYRVGVGHVKKLSAEAVERRFSKPYLSEIERQVARIEARGQTVKKTPEALAAQASLAAKLAAFQKVTPKLEDVCHSLLLDGSAYFDGNTFENWCADLGMNPDSIKDRSTFDACDKIGRDLSRAMPRETLDGLREWASNY